ncbi:MAG: YdeI/OmpD-associated family protein, partial [Planctomycetota bacterium]
RKLALKQNPRLRITGSIAGIPYEGAFQPTKDKSYYLILSKKFCQSGRISLGDNVLVQFEIADQDAVNVPPPLQHAINANDRARKIWESISAGKKRGFAYRVASAKRAETIENRIEEVLTALIALEKQ